MCCIVVGGCNRRYVLRRRLNLNNINPSPPPPPPLPTTRPAQPQFFKTPIDRFLIASARRRRVSRLAPVPVLNGFNFAYGESFCCEHSSVLNAVFSLLRLSLFLFLCCWVLHILSDIFFSCTYDVCRLLRQHNSRSSSSSSSSSSAD